MQQINQRYFQVCFRGTRRIIYGGKNCTLKTADQWQPISQFEHRSTPGSLNKKFFAVFAGTYQRFFLIFIGI